jgi:hypothetical protein
MARNSEISPGKRVRILYPLYACNLTGVVLCQEEQTSGVKTGCWLIDVEAQDMILALEAHEFELLSDA